MSEFVYLFRSSDDGRREAMGTPEAAQQSLETWMAWIRGLEESGHLKNRGQPLAPEGKVVRGNKKLVTDGPYAEAKELVLGFIIVEARDMRQAVDLAIDCPIVVGGGSLEIRPVMSLPI